ncbi:phage tail protein, partial [Pseudomonas aegrilactucae]
ARVLVKNQAAGKDNGLYLVASGAWTRCPDADSSAKVTPGLLVLVERGTANGDSGWQLITDAPITLGVTALAFEMAFGRSGVAAGTYRCVKVDAYGRVVAATNPATLDGYGITDAYTKAQVEAMIAEASAMPVGFIAALPVNKVPPGWLEVDYSVHSIAAYPDLAAFLGSAYNNGTEPAGYFRLPESRGEFLRGWDHGRGINAGRGLGTYELDQFKSHSHMVPNNPNNSQVGSSQDGGEGNSGYNEGSRTAAEGGSETRPRNLAVMWCIKAWNAPINRGQIDIAALAVQVAQFQNQVDFAVVYPAGGSKANPANVAINSRYVEANPFPSATVICRAEVMRNGSWGETGIGDHTSLGGTRVAAGVHAAQLGDSIIVQTALNYLTYPSTYSGDPSGSGDSVATPLPCRVLVWKVRGVIV